MPSEITESIVYTPSSIDEWSALEFVAPANGFVGIFIAPQGNGNSIVKLQQGIDGDFDYQGLSVTSTSQKSSSRVIGCYIPVSNGKSIKLSSIYMNSSGLCVCRFVYSVGEAKRLGLI